MKPKIVLASIVVGLLFFSSHGFARPRPAAVPYRSQLQRIDKVELLLFQTRELAIERVLATKTLEGNDAASIASLWRRQVYRFSTPICHYPIYGVKFYRRGREILYASVCWECDNIVFMNPRLSFKQGFNSDSKSGKELLEVFRKAFPKP